MLKSKKKSKEKKLQVIITYLISKWIEKNHPGTQYNLVVKKGISYVKKNADSIAPEDPKYPAVTPVE